MTRRRNDFDLPRNERHDPPMATPKPRSINRVSGLPRKLHDPPVPSVRYSAEIADHLIYELESGRTPKNICDDDPGMPTPMAVLKWVREDRDGFRKRYEEARMIGYHLWADEIIDIVDSAPTDQGMEALAKARLQIDVRRWFLGKVLPKLYGDKVTISGDPNAPLVVHDDRPVLEGYLTEFAAKRALKGPDDE